jgi:hypothetical protein
MKSLLTVAMVITILPLANGANITFPAGSFEGGTAASWEKNQTGSAAVTTPTESGNTFGRIHITGSGEGTLANVVPSQFGPNSLYVVSIELRSNTMASLASGSLVLQVVDGDGNVVKELTQDEALNAFGNSIGSTSTTLTPILQALAGDSGLISRLRTLLETVSAGSDPDGVLGASDALLDALLSEDQSVLPRLVDVLGQAASGVLDVPSLTDPELASLLDVDELSPLVDEVRDIVTFLPTENGPITALVNALRGSSPGNLQAIDDVLDAIVGDGNLLQPVADILTYALADDGLLATLTAELTRGLLGGVDPSQTDFQPISLIFSTGAVPPPGGIGLRISSGATGAVAQTADVDNISVRQFALALPPSPRDLLGQPVVKIFGKSKRNTPRAKVMIRGSATIAGGPVITAVQYVARYPGHRGHFRKAKGTTRWHTKIALKSTHTRILVRAVASNGLVSPKRRVRIVRTTPAAL